MNMGKKCTVIVKEKRWSDSLPRCIFSLMTDDYSHPSPVTMGRRQLAGTPRAWVGENEIFTGREANQSQDEFELFS
jgi:hypothetical protein